MKWYNILFLAFITLALSDCSGCSTSSRNRQRQELYNITDEAENEEESIDASSIHGNSDDGYNLPRTNNSSGEVLTIAEISKKAEPCVFLVNTFDENGEQLGMGTGFFIEASGIGVSNFHVFENGSQWTIQTSDNQDFKVSKILEYSEDFDYVIFQVEKGNRFPTLPISNTTPEKGEDIVVLGNPKGLESTLTRGIISSIREHENNDKALLQIDAAISPGSSGSPVMNMRGEVVGIATMKLMDCENCNFAMNINVLD